MKKIALLRAYPKSSALGRVISYLAKEYRVDCYLWDRQRDYVPIIENENVRYIRCVYRAGFYSIGTFMKLFLFEIWLFFKLLFDDFDAIHAFDLDTGLVGLIVARLRRKSFVYHCLDPYYGALPKQWPRVLGDIAKRLETMVIDRSDLFVITDMLRMPQHEGATPRNVIEIANVPLETIPQSNAHSNETFMTGFIGSLSEDRGLGTIIDAVSELGDQGVRMIIGGFGPLEEEIRRRAEPHENITFTGWIPYTEVLEIEKGFDLFLLMVDKRHEGFRWGSSNKFFESMAFGKPIIAAEGTLMAQRIELTGNGITVPYGDKEALKKAILFMKDNPEELKRMGQKGRTEYESNWTSRLMEKRLLKAYREMSGKETGRG